MIYITRHAYDRVISFLTWHTRESGEGAFQVEKYQNDTKNTARIESIEDHYWPWVGPHIYKLIYRPQ